MKTFATKDAIYHRPITVIVDCDYDELKEYMAEKWDAAFDQDMDGTEDGGFFYTTLLNGEPFHLLWVRRWEWKVSCIVTVTHELSHGVYRTLSSIGLKPSKKSEEAYRYYLDYQLGQILNELLSKKRNAKKSRS